MSLDRGSLRALSTVLLFAASGSFAAEQKPAERPPLVVLELTRNGGELSAGQGQAVEKAVLAMARAADVILCQDGRSSLPVPALEALCARPDRDLPRLWWRARVTTPRLNEKDFLRLSLELEAGPKAPVGPAQLMLVSSTPLPAGRGEGDLLDTEVTASLADLPDLQNWFLALRQRPDLTRPWPSEPAPAAKAETPPESRKKIEIEGKVAASTSFLVREALVRGGFSQGVTGNLRISPAGLSFTLNGKSREEWAISWRDLKEVSKDAGTWDISHPLVVVDQKGRKRYIARIDGKGNYLPGDAILAAIATARRQS